MLRLDTHALGERLRTQGAKQAWLAERVGVDRKTVTRWATGRVKRLDREHAVLLAEALGCAVEDLTVKDEADVLATKEEQRVAAKLIQERDLLARLAPTDDWKLAESLIRATLQPNLPLAALGRLYNLLAIAAWRQGKYDEALRHAERAREIGERAKDAKIVCGAVYNTAVVESLRGDHLAALASYERCLERPEDFETERDRGKVLSNISMCYRDVGRLDEALARQREAIEVFEALGLDLNLAIAFVSLGYVLTDLARFEEAEEAQRRAEDHARRAGYARGVDCAPIYRADPLSLRGKRAEARKLVRQALPRLARHEVYDLGCHEIAARVLRRASDLAGAAAQLAEGLRRSEEFPSVHAALSLEEARLALARGDAKGEKRARAAANAAFERAGLSMRRLTRPVSEYATPSGARRP
ncbi:MAG: tetratricopeptide repeat protein [Planctomycetota bacterium]